jgi:hypothetical protein
MWIVAGWAVRGSFPARAAPAAEPPSALALLRGVEMARKPNLPLRARIVYEQISPGRSGKLECIVECDGVRRRFEHPSSTRGVSGTVVVMDGEEFYQFRRKENESVYVFDQRRAVGSRGVLCFDPRVLGLSDLMSVDETVRGDLLYEVGKFDVVGREQIDGVSAWRVKGMAYGAEHTFWIEEPSFRVHRMTVRTTGIDIDVRSEYDGPDGDAILPKRVHIMRVEPNRTREREVTVISVEWNAVIPPERFTLKSMNLPKNTPIDDDRIQRRLGYWNGEALSDSPVFDGGPMSGEPAAGPQGGGGRWVAVVLGIVFLLVVVASILFRSRIAGKPGTDSGSAGAGKDV